MVLISRSSVETQKIAAKLTKEALSFHRPSTTAIVIAIEGELGAGKTTFVKGFARALGIKEKISSPTFVILKVYKLTSLLAYNSLVHVDAYRLKDHHDLILLGIKEILADPRNIVLIEWAERVRKILPRKYIKVHIDHTGRNTRSIEILSTKHEILKNSKF